MDANEISQSVKDALEADGYGTAEIRHEIAFHMTDWLSDLEDLYAYYRAPDSLAPGQVSQLLTNFLVHVPNHLAAASKLMTGVPVTDIFDVGATADDG